MEKVRSIKILYNEKWQRHHKSSKYLSDANGANVIESGWLAK